MKQYIFLREQSIIQYDIKLLLCPINVIPQFTCNVTNHTWLSLIGLVLVDLITKIYITNFNSGRKR